MEAEETRLSTKFRTVKKKNKTVEENDVRRFGSNGPDILNRPRQLRLRYKWSVTIPTTPTQAVTAVYEANHKRTKANPFSSHSDTFSSTKRPYISALEDPFWIASMFDEYDAIITSGTFDIKPRPENSNILQPIVLYIYAPNDLTEH